MLPLAVPADPLLADPLTVALSYAFRHWPVLPLTPRGKTPLGTLAPNGLRNATLNESVIRAWWAEEPSANIGLRTGAASGLVGGELLLGVFGAEALAGDLDEVRAVGQAIERGRGQQRLAEEVSPLRAIAIAREHDGAALVPLVDDVVEILGPRRPQRLESEVVEDEQVGARGPRQALLAGAARAPAGEVGAHLVGGH